MSDARKVNAGRKKKQIHRAKRARWRTAPRRFARQDDTEGLRRTEAQKLRSRPQNYGLPRRPLPFSPAEISTGFSRNLLDTRCRTASHPSDSKQKIGVMLTRHTKEVSPQQVFHPNPARGRLPWFYGRCEAEGLRPNLTNQRLGRPQRQKSRRDAGATTATLPAPFLTLSTGFPIIARRLLHRPIPHQAKEPRV
jgi:hypothetical protein